MVFGQLKEAADGDTGALGVEAMVVLFVAFCGVIAGIEAA